MVKGRAVFLDRDGVLVVPEFRGGRSYAPRLLEDFRLYGGAIECTRQLKAAGFKLVVVTNQPDVGNGTTERGVVEQMHSQLMQELPLDDVQVCYHTQHDGCACRKPQPGLLVAAAKTLGLDFNQSFMVGDRRSDVEAGLAVGCRTVFIDLGYQEARPQNAHHLVSSLEEATETILTEFLAVGTRG